MGLTEMQQAPRCKARSKSTGERCKSPAVYGLKVCTKHGGKTPTASKKSLRARAVTEMQAYVRPLAPGDPEANPITAFETEFRRTLGRIRWYDEQLSKMDLESLTWGRTKKENIGAGEFTGTNVTYEAKVNVIHELQFRERQHLLAMEKIWLGAKFEQAKLDMQRAYVTQLDNVIVNVLGTLGHDVADPEVRQVVRDQLLALPMREA